MPKVSQPPRFRRRQQSRVTFDRRHPSRVTSIVIPGVLRWKRASSPRARLRRAPTARRRMSRNTLTTLEEQQQQQQHTKTTTPGKDHEYCASDTFSVFLVETEGSPPPLRGAPHGRGRRAVPPEAELKDLDKVPINLLNTRTGRVWTVATGQRRRRMGLRQYTFAPTNVTTTPTAIDCVATTKLTRGKHISANAATIVQKTLARDYTSWFQVWGPQYADQESG